MRKTATFLNIYCKLSEKSVSLRRYFKLKNMAKRKAEEDDDLSFLSELSGAWDDGITIEEKMKEIRGDYDPKNEREVETWERT